MKKHLIAAAVAAAVVAPAAMAQNVTVYGILDTGVQYFDDGTDSYVRSVDNALATSRLGFRGSEDLGGGLKAEFQLEARLNPSAGNTKQTAAATSTLSARNSSNYKATETQQLFGRESWVGLSGGFGAIRLGTTDVTDANNIDSKVSYSGDLALSAAEFDGDLINTMRYTTPNLNGFQIQLGMSNSNAENKTGQVSSIYAQYEAGPLGIYAGYSTLKASTTQTDKDSKIGVKYDFGMFAAGVSYYSRSNEGVADYKRTVANVAVPLGNGVTLHGVYKVYDTSGTSNGPTTDVTTGDTDTAILAVTKALSKRTTVYAAYTDVDNGGGAGASKDTSATTIGIRHSF